MSTFGVGLKDGCPGSGHTELSQAIELEYSGSSEVSCDYSIFAPEAKKLKITINELQIHDGDYMDIVVGPTFGGYRLARLTPTSTIQVEQNVKSRFLKLFWKNEEDDEEAKWQMKITPIY